MLKQILQMLVVTAAVLIGLAKYNGLAVKSLDVRDSFLPELWRYSKMEPLNNNCHVVTADVVCEDAKYDSDSGLFFLACAKPDERRKWFPGSGLFTHPEAASTQVDRLYSFDPSTEKLEKLEIDGFEGKSFTSHGLDLFTLQDGTKLLAAINHRGVNTSVISLFRLDSSKQATFLGDVQHDLVLIPNSVALFYTPEGQLGLIATNDHFCRRGKLRTLAEVFGLKATYLVYCGIDLSDLSKTTCHKVAEDLVYPNGITHIPGTFDFVQTDSRDSKVRHWSWNSTSQKLDLNSAVVVGAGMDNVRVIPDTKDVIVAGFPNLLEVIHKYENLDDPNYTISTVALRLNYSDGYQQCQVMHKSNGDNGYFLNTVYNYLPNAKILVSGSALSPGLVVCKLEEN